MHPVTDTKTRALTQWYLINSILLSHFTIQYTWLQTRIQELSARPQRNYKLKNDPIEPGKTTDERKSENGSKRMDV